MSDRSITFDILARGRETGLDKMQSKINLVAAAAGALAVKFGIDSVKAYTEAQSSQAKLTDAFGRFPKLADTSVASLQNLNSALEAKTKFDDDATASGQAVLAQFGLTGKQLTTLTPLLQDYAAKTGKDLPTAATDLGKALLGQGRSLKAVGINFKSTGSEAGNFKELVGGLRTQVGGFATNEGKTAAGQAAIMRNEFGEVQEAVGKVVVTFGVKLLPILTKSALFIQKNANVIIPLVGAFAALVGIIKVVTAVTNTYKAVQAALDVVLTANPIGIVIVALAALVAGLVIAYQRSAGFRAIVQVMWGTLKTGALNAVSFVLSMLDKFLGGIHGVASALGHLPGPLGAPFRSAATAIEHARATVQALQGSINSLRGKNVNVGVTTTFTTVRRSIDLGGGSRRLGVGMNAGGTSSWRGGLTWVGERGPELISLPHGTAIYSNQQSRGMASGGSSEVMAPIQLVVDGKVLHQVLLKVKRDKGNLSLGLA